MRRIGWVRTGAAVALLVGASSLAVKPASIGASATLSSTETGIVVRAGDQVDPWISGPYVAFVDEAPDGNIFYFDRTDGTLHAVATGPADQIQPDVSGTRIVYSDWTTGLGEVFLYDISTGTTTDVSNSPANSDADPVVSSQIVAWNDQSGDNDIWVHSLTGAFADHSVTAAGSQVEPAASGTRVAYVDAGANQAIKVFDTATNTVTTAFAGFGDSPAIDGTHVAFTNENVLNGNNVAVADLTTNSTTTLLLAGDQQNPDISGDWVSFEDLSSGNAHVCLWHWTSGQDHWCAGDPGMATPSTSIQSLNALDGNRMVYVDNRSGNLDIYTLDFSVSSAPVLAAQIQQPINSDGSSVFSAKRGVVPVKFSLTSDGTPTCSLPPATIAVTRTAGGTTGAIDESTYTTSADSGSNFRIDAATCQYVYNLAASALGPGSYLVRILISSSPVGSATFGLK